MDCRNAVLGLRKLLFAGSKHFAVLLWDHSQCTTHAHTHTLRQAARKPRLWLKMALRSSTPPMYRQGDPNALTTSRCLLHGLGPLCCGFCCMLKARATVCVGVYGRHFWPWFWAFPMYSLTRAPHKHSTLGEGIRVMSVNLVCVKRGVYVW